MSDNKWTPEPWSNSPLAKPNIIITDKDWFRAVECVNALAGEKDPAEFVKLKFDYEKELFEMRALLKAPHGKTTIQVVIEILKHREELAEQVKKLEVLVRSNLDLL